MTNLSHSSRTPWLATPLIAIAVYASLWSFSFMIAFGSWIRTLAWVLLVVLAAVVVMRLVTRSRMMPSLVGLLVLVVVMIPTFTLTDEGQRRWLPSPSSLNSLGVTLRDGVEFASTTIAPAPGTRELVALLTVVMALLFLVAEHLAVSWRAVAVSGMVLVLPWLLPIVLSHRVSVVALFVALGCWFASMTVARRGIGATRPATLSATALATIGTLLAAAIVAPAALGGNGWGALPRIDTPDALDGGATRLNLALDLRNSLTSNSTDAVISYYTTGPKPGALRMYSLVDFDGTGWIRDDVVVTPIPARSGVLWPDTVTTWGNTPLQRIDIAVDSLSEANLPLPTGPRTVDVPGNFFYDASHDEVVGQGVTTRNLQYAVVTDPDFHSVTSLRADESLVGVEGEDETDPRFTAIPPAVDLARIEALALEVVGAATSRYDQAVAIQEYLRDTQTFTYDTSVNPTGSDSVSAFLDAQAGYCLQFSTTMVVMLRALGIPSRLAVGFLGGELDQENYYVIRGGDAHSWPEVYFPGDGWVRFEPTPSVQTGAPPAWTNPYIGQVPVPADVLAGNQQADLPQAVPDGTNPGDPTQIETDATAPTTPWWPFLILLLALIGLAGWWLWRRRTEILHIAESGPEGAWTRLRRLLPDEFRWHVSLTPHEGADFVERKLAALRAPQESIDALWRLSHAVSDFRYSPIEPTVDQEILDADTAAVVAAAIAADDDQAPPPSGRPLRVGARNAPQAES